MTQLAALLWTLGLEGAFAALVGRRLGAARARRFAALAAVLGSLATHPVVWALNEAWAKPGGAWVPKILVLELGAALAESAAFQVLARMTWPRALLLSALTNAFSFGVGLLLYALGLL